MPSTGCAGKYERGRRTDEEKETIIMAGQFDRELPNPQSLIPNSHLPVRHWWDQASEADQDAVLANVRLCHGMAGVPWAFLPDAVQAVLVRRVRIAPKEEEGVKDEG